ncbi:MAG: sugar ABC transporter permease [Actinomycetota bacterium]|nr:sugar ABC transporter permease [Actinomycetota bacterium]
MATVDLGVGRVTPSRRSRSSGRRGGRRRVPRVAPYLFVLPNMLAVGLFAIWPAVNGFRESFFHVIEGQPSRFAGLANYRQLVTDAQFWAAVRSTLEFVVGFVALTVVLATAAALLLQSQRRAKGLFRAALYVPVLISPVVVGILWNWILNPTSGVLDALLHRVGLGQPSWLVEPHLAMGSAIFVELWATLGFYTLIVLGGLQSIDPSLYEAARVDGASSWDEIWRITLPSLRPTLLVVVILSTITGFQAFEFIYTLTGGGPLGATTLIVQYIYDHAFVPPINFGLATAASVLLFLVLFAITLVNLAIGRRKGAA